MELGMIGLGRMGGNMVRRLLLGGCRVVAYDQRAGAVQALVQEKAVGASSLRDLAEQLNAPRAVWVMVPAGEATEDTINMVADTLSPGDVIIDGGNSNYKDSVRRAKALEARGLSFLDAGTSGGVWGLAQGYSLMVGGDPEVFRRVEPIFQCLAPAPDKGYGHVGPAGAGHFVKMIHNAIEYGLMEAYAEGFEILEAKPEFNLDLGKVAEIWRFGSVVRSWLLDITAAALQENPKLEGLQAYVEDSGEGRWTVQESVDLAIPAPVITLSLQARFRSRQEQPYSGRMLALMRNQFGGHEMRKTE